MIICGSMLNYRRVLFEKPLLGQRIIYCCLCMSLSEQVFILQSTYCPSRVFLKEDPAQIKKDPAIIISAFYTTIKPLTNHETLLPHNKILHHYGK